MKSELTPRRLSEVAGISASYASMMLNGRRPVPPSVSLTVFRELGLRLGVLAEMTEADLDQLCATRSHGGPFTAGDGGVSASKQGADCAPARYGQGTGE